MSDGIWEYITNHIDDNDKYQRQIHIFIEFLFYGDKRALTSPCLLFYFILLFFLDRFFFQPSYISGESSLRQQYAQHYIELGNAIGGP